MTWFMYKLYCRNRGLAEGDFKNFKAWIEGSNPQPSSYRGRVNY